MSTRIGQRPRGWFDVVDRLFSLLGSEHWHWRHTAQLILICLASTPVLVTLLLLITEVRGGPW